MHSFVIGLFFGLFIGLFFGAYSFSLKVRKGVNAGAKEMLKWASKRNIANYDKQPVKQKDNNEQKPQ